ncbi:MAG: glutamate-1-semialdehyde 2,1-aminomutase [Thermoanaerobaculia bacterium]|nr:glutamate-1-semialdehyde 2,1-aminomutase [Thermoanaerobaculia bacterium]
MTYESSASAPLFERAQKVIPGGVHSPVRSFRSVGGTPIFFKSSEGARLTSVDDETFIDFCMSFGPLILGHRDPDVSEVVRETLDLAWTFGACEPYSLELSEWIQERIPWAEKLRFVSSGTEAVMSAIRIARGATERRLILKFDGCYHGHGDSLLVKAGSGLAGPVTSSSAGVSTEVAGETIVASLDSEQDVTETFETYEGEIAAVILEPLPANNGLLIQRREFLDHVVNTARRNGALVIFDEVITGFRLAVGGMSEILGIKPDLVTYGKVIGGGFPIGCYAGRKDLMDLIAPTGPVYQAGTLAANPVGVRAGLATLQKAERIGLWSSLEAKGKQFAEELRTRFRSVGAALDVTQYGSLVWIHGESEDPIRQVEKITQEHADTFAKLFHAALENGVYLAPSAYEVGFLSAAHDDQTLEAALDGLEKAAKAIDGD